MQLSDVGESQVGVGYQLLGVVGVKEVRFWCIFWWGRVF